MTSFIFPGQGSQIVGMAKDFYDNFDIAKLTFEEIQDYVNINLKEIIFEDKKNQLNLTNFTQLCIFTASIAIYRSFIKETNFDVTKIKVMLGHSLGEYTALACSNKLNLKDCSLVLKKRSELMGNSVKPNLSGMAALIGKNVDDIENIIKENNLNIEIANDNSPIQVVISGDSKNIDKSHEIFLKNNIKRFVKLNVSAAFHSKFMIEAQNELSNFIDKLKFNNNDIKIISNFNAECTENNILIIKSLKKQMANRVRWTESINTLAKLGINQIIEIGPGKVLSGLIKRISNSFDIKNITNISDLKNNE